MLRSYCVILVAALGPPYHATFISSEPPDTKAHRASVLPWLVSLTCRVTMKVQQQAMQQQVEKQRMRT